MGFGNIFYFFVFLCAEAMVFGGNIPTIRKKDALRRLFAEGKGLHGLVGGCLFLQSGIINKDGKRRGKSSNNTEEVQNGNGGIDNII